MLAQKMTSAVLLVRGGGGEGCVLHFMIRNKKRYDNLMVKKRKLYLMIDHGRVNPLHCVHTLGTPRGCRQARIAQDSAE